MAQTAPLDPVTGCTPKETKAIQAIAMGMSRDQASKHAGYSSSNLSRALRRPRCQAYMKELFEKAQDEFNFTRADVVKGLKAAIDDASILSDPTAQIAGWREIGKILGLYAPEEKKIVLTSDQERLRNQLETIPEEELLRLAGSISMDVIEGECEEVDDDG